MFLMKEQNETLEEQTSEVEIANLPEKKIIIQNNNNEDDQRSWKKNGGKDWKDAINILKRLERTKEQTTRDVQYNNGNEKYIWRN